MLFRMTTLPISVTRRRFLERGALAGRGRPPRIRAAAQDTITLPFANGERQLVKYPQKRPLILLTTRPPQLETPFSVFNEGIITPNDAFFVRYHLANIPTGDRSRRRSAWSQGQGEYAADALRSRI